MKKRRFINRSIDALENAQERFEDYRGTAEEKIKENPFASIVIAAAIGAVVGIITTEIIRRSKKNRE